MTERNPAFREWVGSTYTYREYQSMGYVMGDFKIASKFNIVTGLRLEHTDIQVESDTLSTKFALDTATGTIYYPSEKRFTDIKYLAWLPALNFNYSIRPDMMLRFAVSRTYHRQNFAETKPGFAVIKYTDFEFVFGNPNLKPAYSYNFDLMYELYWGNKGMFSIGTYYKYVIDHIFATAQADFDARTGIVFKSFTNAGKSWVWGAEVNLQRKFDFIPSWGSGFGVNANITYSISRMQVAPGREIKQAMAEQTPLLYNVALFYEKYGVNARIALNYTGAYLKELNLASVKGIGLIHKNTDFDIFRAKTIRSTFSAPILSKTILRCTWKPSICWTGLLPNIAAKKSGRCAQSFIVSAARLVLNTKCNALLFL
ncbi:MAG: TonB-dependent receptor, partial [Bacteroidetes bacterium]|nr:TonB-dependent receptor [Bacteroidota bacterium]